MSVRIDLKKVSGLQILYLILTIVSAILLIIIRKQPLEFITALLVGIFVGSITEKKQKLIFYISIFIWLVAIVFDPIIKPMLDLMFEVNTVGSLFNSFIQNSILLLLFWIGFFFGKKHH